MNKKIIPENVYEEIKTTIDPDKKGFGCNLCGGSGYKSIELDDVEFKVECDCAKAFKLKTKMIKSNIPEIYRGAELNFDDGIAFSRVKPKGYKQKETGIPGKGKNILRFTKPENVDINKFGKQYVDVCSKYLSSSERDKSVGLLLSGSVGSGKTSLACAIGKEMLEKKYNVEYLKAKQYIDYIIKDSFNCSPAKMSELKNKRDYLNGFNKDFSKNCHLLILDELGFEQQGDTKFSLGEMKDLLRNRAEKALPTIITTNFFFDELSELYEEELMSMFAESYLFFLVISTDDYRIKKSKELEEGFDFNSILK